MFSARSSVDLSPNPLTEALERRGGRAVLDLTTSNPTSAAIPYDRDAILSALALPPSLVYEPAPFGLDSAREAVARDLSAHGPPVDAARVALTASTSEAYAFLFKLLCDPGDEMLVPRPSYPLFEHLARLESVAAVPYRLAYDGAWHVDLPSVRAAITPRTRGIVTVSPNNPTGSYLKRGELAELAALGLPIVSDEVFARYSLRERAIDATQSIDARTMGAQAIDATEAGSGVRARSALEARDQAPLVFALGGLSKLAALPQAKLAWMAVGGEPARVEAALARLEVIADAFLSVAAPVQHALPALLASRAVAEQAIRQRTRDNLAWLAAAVTGSAASLLDVEGGWYATLRLPRTRGEEAWALAFLEDDGVLVHPGHFFDFEDEAYVVVSLLTPGATLREGARRILDRVARGA
jgi:alanine-synthesizing transaminase